MPACVAVGCTNRTCRKIPGLSFHKFPSNPRLRNAWIVACRRKDWMPSNISVLCSIHFNTDDIYPTKCGRQKLKENAVPCIFKGFPSRLKKAKKTRKAPAKRNFVEVEKETATSTMKGKTTPQQITRVKIEEFAVENDDIITSPPACSPASEESVLGDQTAVLSESTDSVPAVIESHLGDTATSKKNHENANLKQELDELEGTIFKCYKIINEPATSTIATMPSETTLKKITMSKNGKCVFENGDIITFLPACFSASGESALGNQTAGVLESTDDNVPAVIESYGDAAMSPIKDQENEDLKRKIEELEDTIIKYRKKVKLLQQGKRRAREQAMKFRLLYEGLRVEQFFTHDALELPIEILLTNTASPDKECLKQQRRKLENKKDVCNTLSESDSLEDLNSHCNYPQS